MKKLILITIALLSLQSCQYGRMIYYYTADIDDHKIFPYTKVNTGTEQFHFIEAKQSALATKINELTFGVKNKRYSLTETLDKFTETTAFLVIKNDSIVYENYFEGYKRDSISTIFSVSKSVTSLLVGIAVEEGKITSVHDPITKYIPELSEANATFNKLTIEHLLNMRSGLKFRETYSNPFDEVTKLYYGRNQLNVIKKLKFIHQPGEKHEYQSVCTAMLGIAIERATNKQLGKYLEEKLWIPLGMENNATWSYDGERNKNAKAFSGLNTTAIDLAKIARLMIHKGKFNGKQIVTEEWVNNCVTPNKNNDYYQYQWYGFKNSDDIFAIGILGQEIYFNARKNLTIIRLGKSWTDTDPYVNKIKALIK